MTPDLKQLRDLVREMRRQCVAAYGCALSAHEFLDKDKDVKSATAEIGRVIKFTSTAMARADALIGPGDGFQEVERLNEGAESDAS